MSQSRQTLNRQPRQPRLFDTQTLTGPMPQSRTVIESYDAQAPYRVIAIHRTADSIVSAFHAGTADRDRAVALAIRYPTRALVLAGDDEIFDNGKDDAQS